MFCVVDVATLCSGTKHWLASIRKTTSVNLNETTTRSKISCHRWYRRCTQTHSAENTNGTNAFLHSSDLLQWVFECPLLALTKLSDGLHPTILLHDGAQDLIHGWAVVPWNCWLHTIRSVATNLRVLNACIERTSQACLNWSRDCWLSNYGLLGTGSTRTPSDTSNVHFNAQWWAKVN